MAILSSPFTCWGVDDLRKLFEVVDQQTVVEGLIAVLK